MDWEELKKRVDEFCDILTPGLVSAMLNVGRELLGLNYKQLWADARAIQDGFNSKPRFPTRQEREECWERFNKARSVLKESGDRERENRFYSSKVHFDLVMDYVREAGPNGWDSSLGYPGSPDLLKEKGELLRKAGKLLSERKQSMIREHKAECFAEIQKVRDDLDRRWAHLRGQRVQHNQDRNSRIQANIDKNKAALAKCEAALERQEEHRRDLQNKLSEARSGSYRERVQSWMDECEERISSMNESRDRLRSWISEGEGQLR